MNAGDRKIGLVQPIADIAAGEEQLSLRASVAIGLGRCSKLDGRCAATHRAALALQIRARVARKIVIFAIATFTIVMSE
jgi:hypothetical protein